MDATPEQIFKDMFSRSDALQIARATGAVQRLRDVHPQDFCLALGLGQAHVGKEMTDALPYRGAVAVDAEFAFRGKGSHRARVVRVTVEEDCRDGTVQPVDIWLAWRWTAVFVHALRQALCPSPTVVALMQAAARGDLAHSLDDGRRTRVAQAARLAGLLKEWILG